MASEIINGEAVIHGIQNNGSRIALTGYATFRVNKLGGKHKFDLNRIKDEIGYTQSLVGADESIEISMDFSPTGATRAAAHLLAKVPTPLASLTLSNCRVQNTFGSSAVKIFDGAYVYTGGASIDLVEAAQGKISGMTLEKWADATQNTALNTTVSG